MRWEAVDDQTAVATLIDGPLGVTLRFAFSAAGPIDSVRADARAASVGTRLIMMPVGGPRVELPAPSRHADADARRGGT